MEKLFFITTLMLNLDTGVVTPKYQQLIYFYDRPSCEAYVQQNWTALHNGFKIYMDYNDINGRIESMGCTGLTKEEIEKLQLEIDEEDDFIST